MTSGNANGAYGIGNNGIITGRALYDGVVTGFVMIPNFPIPKPSTYALFGLGIIGLLLVMRRKTTAQKIREDPRDLPLSMEPAI